MAMGKEDEVDFQTHEDRYPNRVCTEVLSTRNFISHLAFYQTQVADLMK